MDEIVAAIIGGGEARRLGGRDKALVSVRGEPQLARLLRSLRVQSARQVMVSKQPAADYAAFGITVIQDEWPGPAGPLAGLDAALRHAAPADVLCVPVDALWLPPDLLPRLAAARKLSGSPAACVHDGVGLQPVCCLLSSRLVPTVRQALQTGERAAHRWLKSCGAVEVDFSHWPRWAWSFNTEQELREAEQRLDET